MAPTGLKTLEIVLENKKRVKAVVAYDCTMFQYVILNYDLAVNVEGRPPMIDSLSWTYYRNIPTPEGEDSGRGGVTETAKGYWGLHKSECGLAGEGNFREIEMVRLRDAGRVYEDKGYRKKQGNGYFSSDGKIYMVVDGSGAE